MIHHDPAFTEAWDALARQDRGEAPASTACIPVEQSGRVVGSLPSGFNTSMARSTSPLYDIRRGDLERQADKIVAHSSLGMGDLTALPGFVPAGATARDRRDDSDLLAAVTGIRE